MRQTQHRGQTLDYLSLCPEDHAEGQFLPLVICLHGYGAGMEDLTGLAEAIDPQRYVYVFPNGPRPAFDGADTTSRAWFERGGHESPEGVREALQALDGFVREVLARYQVPAGRCLLLGFSQGGNLALRYGLPRPDVFAALAVLSGSLRQPQELKADLPASRKQPLFLAHGTADAMIPVEWGKQAAAFLQGQGYQPVFKQYHGMGHSIGPALLADLRAWVLRTLPP